MLEKRRGLPEGGLFYSLKLRIDTIKNSFLHVSGNGIDKSAMKYLILLTLFACSALKTKNLEYVQIGMDEKVILEDFYVRKYVEMNNHKFISIHDGILVSKDSRIIDKFPLSHPYDFTATVSTYTSAPNQKFTYFIEANQRMVDSRSIYFNTVRKMVTSLLTAKGQSVTDDKNKADAVLSIGYAIGSFVTKSYTNDPLSLMSKTTYNRLLHISAYKTSQPDINIWESKVESPGPENDPSIYVPGLLAAVGDINGKSEEAVQVTVDESDVYMNLYVNSRPFEKYLPNR